jgi:ferric-dicitrate binding protein FerR (iron transport regulator)
MRMRFGHHDQYSQNARGRALKRRHSLRQSGTFHLHCVLFALCERKKHTKEQMRYLAAAGESQIIAIGDGSVGMRRPAAPTGEQKERIR